MAKKHHPDKNRDIGSCKNYNTYETKKRNQVYLDQACLRFSIR
jgi:hypothetical protein